MELTIEDYIFIEAVGLTIYYHDISSESKERYKNFYNEAVEVSYSRINEEISPAVLKELVAQDAIVFKLQREGAEIIEASQNLHSLFNTILKYSGNHTVSVKVNIDNEVKPTIYTISLDRLVKIF